MYQNLIYSKYQEARQSTAPAIIAAINKITLQPPSIPWIISFLRTLASRLPPSFSNHNLPLGNRFSNLIGAWQKTEEVRFEHYAANKFSLRAPHPKVVRIVALASENIICITQKTLNILLITVML